MVLEPTRFRVPPEYIDPNRMDADAAERSPVRLSIPKAKTLLPIPRPGNTIMYLMPQGTPDAVRSRHGPHANCRTPGPLLSM